MWPTLCKTKYLDVLRGKAHCEDRGWISFSRDKDVELTLNKSNKCRPIIFTWGECMWNVWLLKLESWYHLYHTNDCWLCPMCDFRTKSYVYRTSTNIQQLLINPMVMVPILLKSWVTSAFIICLNPILTPLKTLSLHNAKVFSYVGMSCQCTSLLSPKFLYSLDLSPYVETFLV